MRIISSIVATAFFAQACAPQAVPLQSQAEAVKDGFLCQTALRSVASLSAALQSAALNHQSVTSSPAYEPALNDLTHVFEIIYDARESNQVPTKGKLKLMSDALDCLEVHYSDLQQNNDEVDDITQSLLTSWFFVSASAALGSARVAATQIEAASLRAASLEANAARLKALEMAFRNAWEAYRAAAKSSPYEFSVEDAEQFVKRGIAVEGFAPVVERAVAMVKARIEILANGSGAAVQAAIAASTARASVAAAGLTAKAITAGSTYVLLALVTSEAILVLDKSYNGGRVSHGLTGAFASMLGWDLTDDSNHQDARASAAKLIDALVRAQQVADDGEEGAVAMSDDAANDTVASDPGADDDATVAADTVPAEG